jgi:hypothetical protein
MPFVERLQDVAAAIPPLPFERGGSDDILMQFAQVATPVVQNTILTSRKRMSKLSYIL